MDILSQIKKAGLLGRGGACFPVAAKWEMVKAAPGKTKYVVCNASEGEPGVKKDGYILENFPERVVDGMRLALDFLNSGQGYIYINPKYQKKLKRSLSRLISKLPIELFSKPFNSGYIGGEETSLLNALEGRRIEPRLRPPFPPTQGLWNGPTLINNVETFYNVSLAASNEYRQERFYTLSGDCLYEGVYQLPDNHTIEKVIKETNNYPRFPFFVQVGGDAAGEILNSNQLKRPASGAASIRIYSIIKHKPLNLIKNWLNFFLNESCGQCTPCREGIYRLWEIINSPQPDWKLFGELINNLAEASFCGLGCALSIPLKTYINNVAKNVPAKQTKEMNIKIICECLKQF